jgi:oxaloacetate decarboxylase gamma subunit
MATGMITVFTILFLVVIVSKILIFVINRYFPEEILVDQPGFSSSIIEGSKMSAIVTAIDLTTRGRARIEKIEKIYDS